MNQAKYFSEGFITVANDDTVAAKDPLQKAEKEWVARILEIRASDEHHVYARIYWMYYPDELWETTRDANGQLVKGRQPYHGQNELIASNHSKTPITRAWGQSLTRCLQWKSSTSSVLPEKPKLSNGLRTTTRTSRMDFTGVKGICILP